MQRLPESQFDVALIALRFHVDKIDHEKPAEVAQAHLACDFFSGFEIGLERSFLDVAAARRTCRVDVDGGQGLGVIDHHRAARRQVHVARVRTFDLVFDLEA